jgi:DNA-binding response OmpR family regulator
MYIALLEDDPDQAALMTKWLESDGHSCKTFYTAKSFMDHVVDESFALLILDWALPDIDGDRVLRWVRDNLGWNIPVLFMTFRDDSEDIATILQLGADDYVTKSVQRNEFLARVKSLQRRAKVVADAHREIRIGEFVINNDEHSITRQGEEIKLTPMEFKLAGYLFQNVDSLRSRADLLANVWGRNAEVSTRTVDLHISRLRKKLCLLPENGWHLESVSSIGYRLARLIDDNGGTVDRPVTESISS